MKFMFFFIKLVILPSHEKHPGQKKRIKLLPTKI